MEEIRFGDKVFRFPWANVCRELTTEEYARLKASIEAHGIRHPILHDDQDNVIDGMHRLKVAAELGMALKLVPLAMVTAKMPDEEKLALASELNEARRQFSAKEIKALADARRERVKAGREEGKSLRTLAEEEGVSLGQVQRDVEETGATVSGDTVEGRDRRKRNVSNIGHHKKKKPAEEPATPESETKPKPEREPGDDTDLERIDGEGVDDWGIPIQPHAAEAFADQPLFDELLSALKKARQLYQKLASHAGGAYLQRPGVSINSRHAWKHAGLETCILNVADCRPTYTVCPYSFGKADNFDHAKDCRLCHGLGWVRPLGKDEVPESLVNAAKKAYGVELV